MSETEGLKETVGRFGMSLSIPVIPSPGPYWGASWAMRNASPEEARTGVPFGVPVGVVLLLCTRDCRDPDRGVMLLLLRKDETGVGGISSLEAPPGVSGRAPLLDNGLVTVCGAVPATLGVNGVLFEVFAAAESVGISGLEELLCCLSYGGMFPLLVFATSGPLGGTLILALLSLGCNGDRSDGLGGRDRVGVASGS